MPPVVCVKCKVGYRIEKLGGWVVEMFSNPPKPYKIWSVDAHKCPGCGDTIMSGYGNGPIAEHYQENFQDILKNIKSSSNWVIECYERVSDAAP